MAKQPPRYVQIADALRAKISSGEWGPGHRLPSENLLIAEFETGRGTVRAALAVLRDEGLTDTRRGAGVFVRKFRPIRRNAQKRLSARVWGRGKAIWDADTEERDYEQLDLQVGRAGDPRPEILRCFGLPLDGSLGRRYRVYAIEGRRLVISTSYLPWDLVKDTRIMEESTGPGGTYARLAELGHAPDHFREEIKARPANDVEAKALQITPSSTVILIARTAFDAEGAPLEVNEMVLDASAYILEYDFSS